MQNIKIISLTVLLAASWLFFFFWKGCSGRSSNMHSGTITNIHDTVPIIKRYFDTSGRGHVVVKTEDGYIAIKGRPSFEQARPYIDSVAAALNIKAKQVQGTSEISSTISYQNEKFLKRQIDSLNGVIASITNTYENPYLKLTARSGNLSDTSDKGSFDYTYKAQINVAQYFKRNNLDLGIVKLPIGRKVSYSDLTTPDPNATINGVRKFTVQNKNPGFGLRLQAATSYNFLAHRLNFGPAVRIDLGRFSVSGVYYYNTLSKEWSPVVSGYFDVIAP